MSYVRETLAPGEEIVMMAHFNWTYWAPSWFWFLLSLVPGGVALALEAEGRLPGEPIVIYILCGAVAVLGSLMLIGHWIHVRTTEIAVTTSRFVFKTGLVSRHSNEISLNKIEEIRLNQSVWGRLFGYGQLILQGTGVGVIKLPEIDNPVAFRRAIESAKSRLRQAPDDREYQNTATEPAPPPSPRGRVMKKRKGRAPNLPSELR